MSTNTNTNTTYNGWTNRETWLVSLWFDIQEIAEDYPTPTDTDTEDEMLDDLANAIRAEVVLVTDAHEDDLPAAGFVADLLPSLSYLTDRINFRELAEAAD